MIQKPQLRHRYTAVFQGMFDGIEWTVYEDRRAILIGCAEDIGKALVEARQAYRNYINKRRGGLQVHIPYAVRRDNRRRPQTIPAF